MILKNSGVFLILSFFYIKFFHSAFYCCGMWLAFLKSFYSFFSWFLIFIFFFNVHSVRVLWTYNDKIMNKIKGERCKKLESLFKPIEEIIVFQIKFDSWNIYIAFFSFKVELSLILDPVRFKTVWNGVSLQWDLVEDCLDWRSWYNILVRWQMWLSILLNIMFLHRWEDFS